jgi:uncharacterized membrane protein
MLKLVTKINFHLFLIVAIATGVILRLVNLGSREFWYDEILSVLLATGQKLSYSTPGDAPVPLSQYAVVLELPPESDLGVTLETVANLLRGLAGDVHPPLSYLGEHFWLRGFGNSEVSLRGLIVLLSLGGIYCIYGLGKSLLGDRGGLILAALLALNPFYLAHSLNVRMYAALVLWVILSAWAAVKLIKQPLNSNSLFRTRSLIWSGIFILAVGLGLLTQYLFAYWVMTLAILVLIFDGKRWWLHGLRLAMGVGIFLPWFFWGTRQQIKNRPDVFQQISQAGGVSGLEHLQDVSKTLGTHLLLGEWVTSLPVIIPTLLGIIVIFLFGFFSLRLWQKQQYQLLAIAWILGIIPLILALIVDVLGDKLTVGFGWGRSLIFILPGCLLLITTWLMKVAGKWQQPIVIGLLLIYLGLNLSDYTLRSRQMFQQIATVIEQQPEMPTLVAMNSKAWGHVLRVAYYLPTDNVSLLADTPANLSQSLDPILQSQTYPRLIWVQSDDPVWSRPKTAAAKLKYEKNIQAAIPPDYQLIQTQELSGTMSIDNFTVRTYHLTLANKPF